MSFCCFNPWVQRSFQVDPGACSQKFRQVSMKERETLEISYLHWLKYTPFSCNHMSTNLKQTKTTSVFCWILLTSAICLHSLGNPNTTLSQMFVTYPASIPSFKHLHSAKWPTTSAVCARLHSASKLICGCDMADQQKDQWSNMGEKTKKKLNVQCFQ